MEEPARKASFGLHSKSLIYNWLVWLFASSRYGKAVAREFARQGWNVIATMRSPEKETELNQLENVLVTRLDVLDMDSVRAARQAGIDRFGKIDVLINNAAHGLVGVFEAMESRQIRDEFAVNVFGYMDVIREILPHFREIRRDCQPYGHGRVVRNLQG